MTNQPFRTLTILLFAGLLLSLPALAEGRTFSGKVRSVQDGDTLTISQKGRWVKINLAGILAPSRKQPLGLAARDYLSELAPKGSKVEITVVRRNIQGDIVGRVSIDGRDLTIPLIEAGLAWATSGSTNEQVAAAVRAQTSSEGVWAQTGSDSSRPSS